MHFWAVPWQAVIAVALIAFGAYIMFNRNSSKTDRNDFVEESIEMDSQKQNRSDFYRVDENKMIAGVCTGLSRYFDIDVTLVRLLWVFATLASGGLTIFAYIIAVIVFPTFVPQIKDGGNQ